LPFSALAAPSGWCVFRWRQAAHLSDEGQVAISVASRLQYHAAFDMDAAAERNNYALPVAHPFRLSDYAGYSHVKANDDGVGAVDESDKFSDLRVSVQRDDWPQMDHALDATLPPGAIYITEVLSREEKRQSKAGSTLENEAIR
jgi:hypothetical protein